MTDDPIDTMLVEVRASTQGFASDIEQMRGVVDGSLADGFARAGTVLERGLLSAVRRGSLGFDDLKRVALRAMDDIAAQALHAGIGSLSAGGGAAPATGLGSLLGGALNALFGLPGRATGGSVSPGRAYMVGEKGPELFVPTSAGRVAATPEGAANPRDVKVSIRIAAPPNASAPASLQRSARQIASSVRRSLREF